MKLVYYRGKELNFGDDLNADLWPALSPALFAEDSVNAFVGMGTIIGRPFDPHYRLNVFSSGIGYDPIENWQGRDVTYWCVRGPVSCQVLGLPADRAITDGAILTPLAAGFPATATPGKTTLIMPHHRTLDFPGWGEVAAKTGSSCWMFAPPRNRSSPRSPPPAWC